MRNHHHTYISVSSAATALLTATTDVVSSDINNHGSNGRNGVEKGHKVHSNFDPGWLANLGQTLNTPFTPILTHLLHPSSGSISHTSK